MFIVVGTCSPMEAFGTGREGVTRCVQGPNKSGRKHRRSKSGVLKAKGGEWGFILFLFLKV